MFIGKSKYFCFGCLAYFDDSVSGHAIKGELQCQNKLISSKRPFRILQNETKIVKIPQPVLEIFNFKDLDLDSFPRKID